MRVLIIGGTKFIGPYVVWQLLAEGHEVTVFHRGQTTADLPSEVNSILGDREQLAEFRTEFEQLQPQVVLDMIAFTEQDALTTLKTFKEIAGRLVVISSLDVYRAYGVLLKQDEGSLQPLPLTEDSELRSQLYPFKNMPNRPLGAPADYEKILVERVIMSDPDLPGTVIRLPMVYGPNDPLTRLLPYLQRMNENRPAIVLEESVANWRGCWGYVENVAAAIALAVVNEKAANRIYQVAELEVFSEQERITQIGEIVGWPGQVIVVNQERLPASWSLPANMAQHWVVDSRRIRQELGYKEPISQVEAVRKTVEWQQANLSSECSPFAVFYLLDYSTEDAIIADNV